MQAIRTKAPRDHVPLVIEMEYRMKYLAAKEVPRYRLDRGALMACMRRGTRRQAFFESLEKHTQEMGD